jgi:Xaa-Pro aminopeptidase
LEHLLKAESETTGDIAGLRRAIDESPFDAVIAASFENIRYISDVAISTIKTIRDRLELIIWAKGRAPIFVLCQVEEGYVRQESWITDIRTYREFFTPPMRIVMDVLRELGLERGIVGCELEYLPGKYVRELTAEFPQLDLRPCDDLFRRVRMFKTTREKELIAHGFRGTEKAMLATYATVQVGEDEWSLSRRLAAGILLSGAESIAFNHINAGPNTGFPHAAPTDYRVRKGDVVKADSGGYYNDYYSNVGRTGKVGEPTADETEWWIKLRSIHHSVAEMLRPGNTGQQVFEKARMLHEKAELPFPYAHNGHSIGLEAHERPLISPHETTAFEPGMICTVETRVRWVGQKGLHMEDLYEITEVGPVLLSNAFDNEKIFVI